MKRHLLFLFLLLAAGTTRAALVSGTEYFIWLNIYEKLLGSTADGSSPALSAWGTNSSTDSYVEQWKVSGCQQFQRMEHRLRKQPLDR